MINDSYNRFEKLPQEIQSIIEEYTSKRTKEDQEHSTIKKKNEATFKNVKNAIESRKQKQDSEAKDNYDEFMRKVNALKTNMETQKKAYNAQFAELNHIPDTAFDTFIKRLVDKAESVKQQKVQDFDKRAHELIMQESELYKQRRVLIQEETDKKLKAETINYSRSEKAEERRFENKTKAIENAMQQRIEDMNAEEIQERFDKLRQIIPKTQSFENAKEMPETIEIGYIDLDLSKYFKNNYSLKAANAVRESLGFSISDLDKHILSFPTGRSLKQNDFNKLILHDDVSKEATLEYMRALELRMFMSIPCGKLRVTMFDPDGLGSNFSMFSCLGEHDPRIISTQIWSDQDRIKEQLRGLITQIEHVNQDCLRSDFADIVAYNDFVGKNAEPLQALFVADFPNHFDKESCELLQKVVSSGPRCGVYTFIASSQKVFDFNRIPLGLDPIKEGTEVFYFNNNKLTFDKNGYKFNMTPISLPEKQDEISIFETLNEGIRTSDRITIYFDEVTDNLTQNEEKWFNFSEQNGIDIPIGQEGASRTVQIHLGGESITQHHAMIVGTIGAGKSTLMHTIIMSTLLHYSPEDVQIFLLDFKRGVEFKCYADAGLSNFRVVSLDTEPEFGLAVLRYLDEEQAIRAQEFHNYPNVSEIEQFNDMAEKSRGEVEKFPRIILIIDEFHELFKDKESEVSKECEKLLERIIKQGRAFGVHVILGSQVLPDNLSGIYSQIMNRIALQCNESTARLILDSNNPAVNTLVSVDPGKGIFNDGGGNRDSNHLFRVAFFPAKEHQQVLKRIRDRQERYIGDIGYDDTRLLLSSVEDNYRHPLNIFVKEGNIPLDSKLGCPIYIGEQVALVDEFDIHLTRRRGQNILIAGAMKERANRIYSFAAMSMIYNAIRMSPDHRLPKEPIITYFDFASTTQRFGRRVNRTTDMMDTLRESFPYSIRTFDGNTLDEGIEILTNEMNDANASQPRQHYVIFAGLNRAKRLLDTTNVFAVPLKQKFFNLVKNGPESGMNFVIWANEVGSFLNFFGELLPEFNYRLVYNLKDEEYESIVTSSANDTSESNSDTIIAYDMNDDNKKVRIYNVPLNGWMNGFVNRVNQFDTFEYDEPEADSGITEFETLLGGDFDDEFDEF